MIFSATEARVGLIGLFFQRAIENNCLEIREIGLVVFAEKRLLFLERHGGLSSREV
jgi:hypothetical protein